MGLLPVEPQSPCSASVRQQVPRQMTQATPSTYLELPTVAQRMGSLGRGHGLGTGAAHVEGCSRPPELIIH